MAEEFFRYWVNDRSFIRGAARLLVAPFAQAFPTKIADVIALATSTGASQIDSITNSGTLTSGTFKISVDVGDGNGAKKTSGLAFDVAAAAVQSALEALTNVAPGDVTAAGGALGTAPITLTWGGALAKKAITVTIDQDTLTGGTVTHTTSTPGKPDAALYDAMPGWVDLGATKTGIQITINNAEETFDIDQQLGIISSAPTTWECSVGTALAESTPERMQVAWEGSAITVDNTPTTGAEKEIGFGAPNFYTKRRLAVLYQRPSGLIRAYLFRQVQRTPQESSVMHAKTGEQQTIPLRFNVLADNTETDVQKQFFIIRDQAVTDS